MSANDVNQKREDTDGLCASCKYWTGCPDTPKGKCRRYPPFAGGRTIVHVFAWPLTEWDDFCGEWKKSESGPNAN